MAKPSTTGIVEKTVGSSLTHTEFNTLNTAVNAVIADYASVSEGVDADTLEGSTKAQVQTHAPASHGNEAHTSTFITSAALSGYEQTTNKGVASGYAPLDSDSKVPTANLPTITSATYGETKLWNKTKNDIPLGWHECDGTNGTEDLSSSNPSTDTVYIMYIGGEYTNMTARTINITNSASGVCSHILIDTSGNAITTVEDGNPFLLAITNTEETAIKLSLICNRTSDNYTIFTIPQSDGIYIAGEGQTALLLTQYIDCTWTLIDKT